MISNEGLDRLIAAANNADVHSCLTELRWRRKRHNREPIERVRDVCLVILSFIAALWLLFVA
jgi:hypothetical protein